MLIIDYSFARSTGSVRAARLTRRRVPGAGWRLSLALGLFAFAAAGASAQSYPERPVRLIVASSPGSGADIVARTVGQGLSGYLGQQVIVDNRAGAGGDLGAATAAKSPPDGYTLFLVTSSFPVNVSLYPSRNSDLPRAFAPISRLLSDGSLLLLTHPSFPAKTVKELIAIAKAKPGQIDYASAGIGNVTHLAGELFKLRAEVNIVHVPYKGGGPALTAIVGGEVPLTFLSLGAMSAITEGRLRALAVTGTRRAPSLPNIPTMIEAGVNDYTITTWYGLLAPVGTPVDTINKLHSEAVKVMQQPAIIKRFTGDGLYAQASTPAELATFIKAEIAKWSKLLHEAKITLE